MGRPGSEHSVGAGVLIAVLALAGCSPLAQREAPPRPPGDLSAVPDAVPRVEPRSDYGNPPWYEVNGRRYRTRSESRGFVERGVASWYGPDFHGKRTSTREVYDMYGMSAAHPSLPLPTYARVTNLENGRAVVVRINDRGPFHDNRVIDLSYTAAYKLGLLDRGTGVVEVRAIDPARPGEPVPGGDSPPSPARRPDLYVQVGAFGSRDNAERLQNRLQGIAPGSVRVRPPEADERRLYRVRVGPLADVDEADRVIALLSDIGLADHRLVVE